MDVLPVLEADSPHCFPTCAVQVLQRAGTEVRQMDVLCWDTVSGEVVLADFHSIQTAVSG